MFVWALLPVFMGSRFIVINTSPSVQPGFYIRDRTEPRVGSLVEFKIPELARSYIENRTGQNCSDWYILKPVLAVPGDFVDTTGAELRVNGNIIAPMPPLRDGAERLLPVWCEARFLKSDEYFVFSHRIPNSFDSRNFGPITMSMIEAVRTPLILFR